MSISRKILNAAFFLIIMGLTFYAVLHGQNFAQIREALGQMSVWCLLLAALSALFFVCAEGFMIWYLLKSLEGRSGLFRCISYSFIGFFYSGITPSATGGQPMQLYYMKKDGNRLADSSVVLMTVALIYKLVLVITGAVILLFWRCPLQSSLHGFYPLYLLGLTLNAVLVAVLLAVMAAPDAMYRIISGLEKGLVRIGILKYTEERRGKLGRFIDSYRSAVVFLWEHKKKVLFVVVCTFLQRSSVFFLTWLIYRGFGLKGAGILKVMTLQASVYIAVDMLPLPGAQGITELMYQTVFSDIFTGQFLMPSLYVTRGINFYFLLFISLAVVVFNRAIRLHKGQGKL